MLELLLVSPNREPQELGQLPPVPERERFGSSGNKPGSCRHVPRQCDLWLIHMRSIARHGRQRSVRHFGQRSAAFKTNNRSRHTLTSLQWAIDFLLSGSAIWLRLVRLLLTVDSIPEIGVGELIEVPRWMKHLEVEGGGFSYM